MGTSTVSTSLLQIFVVHGGLSRGAQGSFLKLCLGSVVGFPDLGVSLAAFFAWPVYCGM